MLVTMALYRQRGQPITPSKALVKDRDLVPYNAQLI